MNKTQVTYFLIDLYGVLGISSYVYTAIFKNMYVIYFVVYWFYKFIHNTRNSNIIQSPTKHPIPKNYLKFGLL